MSETGTTADAPNELPAVPENGTDYVVLRAIPRPAEEGQKATPFYEFVGCQRANNAEQAARLTAGAENEDGCFVAVPTRSWRLYTIRKVTTTRLVVE